MRVLTWNLDRGRRFDRQAIDQQRSELDAWHADIQILTELPALWAEPTSTRVTSTVARPGPMGLEAWVGIEAHGVGIVPPVLPIELMATAARVTVGDDRFVVFGSVLPWSMPAPDAPYLVDEPETDDERFARVLAEQVKQVRRLRAGFPDHILIWAGDFNQPLSGPNRGFTNVRRRLLDAALADLELVAWNHECAHARPPAHAIDLICGPAGRKPLRVERFFPEVDRKPLSDHAGYMVDL